MAVKVKCYNNSGKEDGTISLAGDLFESKFDENSLYYSVVDHLHQKRQNTSKTKTKGEVAGSGKKPWRQKGTGRARVGTRRTPLWIGGGVVFGPKRTEYNFKVNRKVKRKALNTAISKRVSDGRFIVINKKKFDAPSTKTVAKVLKSIGIYGGKVLILDDGSDKNFYRSCRNISGLQVIPAKHVNAYQVVNNDWLVVVKEAVGTLLEVFK
ncbi:50S ribosomal protein L4 [candidate division WOR-3 bacterium]|nr:50S ribosomal protein L4 [candidate division WOR-3 bacterium]